MTTTSHPSKRAKMLATVAGPIARPGRYRRQVRVAAALAASAFVVYVVFGLFPLVVLFVVGGVGGRYALKRTHSSKKLPY
ncbi:MAG: hypothetical protein ACYCV7_05735 [Acidimicrobiales bacterium]